MVVEVAGRIVVCNHVLQTVSDRDVVYMQLVAYVSDGGAVCMQLVSHVSDPVDAKEVYIFPGVLSTRAIRIENGHEVVAGRMCVASLRGNKFRVK